MVIMFSFDFDKHGKYTLFPDWHPNKSVSVLNSRISYLLISVEWNSVQTEKENASMISLLHKATISIKILRFPTSIQLHPNRTAMSILFFFFFLASHFWQICTQAAVSQSMKLLTPAWVIFLDVILNSWLFPLISFY